MPPSNSTEADALARQRALVMRLAAALGPGCAWHETHISLVLVAGGFAWKFKKAVRFDFLDFSTLDARRFYCGEELRLNRRYAPGIYLDVITVTGDPDHPVLEGDGEPLEYAVKMRAFEQSALWTERIARCRLERAEIDALAVRLAALHEDSARSPAGGPWCTPASLREIAEETLDLLEERLPAAARDDAAALRAWEDSRRAALEDVFMGRKADGHIRECHGDLHCGNLLTLDGKVEAFDCIEFSERLRWIDVMNDIAFTCMDLRFRGLGHFAARLLNGYLEQSGDVEGLLVFGYYEVHRALIRCKVALLAPPHGSEEALRYLAFARQRIGRAAPMLVITHGFSGSGKSTLARGVVEALDAIQLRSDVERKRMHGVPRLEQGQPALYSAGATRAVYQRLLALARQVLQAGWTAVVDATFLQREQREEFSALARALGVRFVILSAVAAEDEMRRRIVQRAKAEADPSDASLAVLERQLSDNDPLTEEERCHAFLADTRERSPDALRAWLAELLA